MKSRIDDIERGFRNGKPLFVVRYQNKILQYCYNLIEIDKGQGVK